MFTLPNPDLVIGVGRDISDLNLPFFKVLCSRHTSNAEVPKFTRDNMFSGFPSCWAICDPCCCHPCSRRTSLCRLVLH